MSTGGKGARDYALRLLSQRAYTQKGLYDKLCTRYEEQEAAAAVARMIELNLLDDMDYARRYAEDCIARKGFSPRRAVLELVKKGVDKEIIDDVIAERDDEPQPAIARVIARKFPQAIGTDDEKTRNKAINALLRLGYRYGDVAAVLRNLEEDIDFYEDWEQDE